MHIHGYGVVLGDSCKPENLCIVLHRAWLKVGEVDIGVIDANPAAGVIDSRHDWEQQPVFVAVREFAQDGERVVARWFPSVVRLHPLDECPLARSGMYLIFGFPLTSKWQKSSQMGNSVMIRDRLEGSVNSCARYSRAMRMFWIASPSATRVQPAVPLE